MDPLTGAGMALLAVNQIVGTAFQIWQQSRQMYGQEAIPPWEKIIQDNAALQAEIDAEKKNPV
jgi:hypothetical protein